MPPPLRDNPGTVKVIVRRFRVQHPYSYFAYMPPLGRSQTLTGGGSGQVGTDARPRFDAIFSQTVIRESHGNDRPLLVVEVSDTIPNPDLDRLFDLGDFGFVPKAFGLAKAMLAARAKEILDAAVAGLSLALPPSATPIIETVGTVTFALEPGTERLLYSLDVTGSATMTLATSVSNEFNIRVVGQSNEANDAVDRHVSHIHFNHSQITIRSTSSRLTSSRRRS
jgi:hypothetical protein